MSVHKSKEIEIPFDFLYAAEGINMMQPVKRDKNKSAVLVAVVTLPADIEELIVENRHQVCDHKLFELMRLFLFGPDSEREEPTGHDPKPASLSPALEQLP